MQYLHTLKEKLLDKNKIILYIILLMLLLVSCGSDDSNNSNSEETKYQIYYLDATQTSIVGMDYIPTQTDAMYLIDELIDALSQSPESSSMKKAKPDSVIIKDYQLKEDGRLTLDFSPEYKDLEGVSEVLCRATIVKTLSQVEEVKYIEFTVSGQPLMDSKDKPVGLMENDDIIHSIYAEDVYVTVYFSNEEGTALVPSNLKMTYDGNITIAELIINRLILGPVETDMLQTIPEGTKLNSVTIKEGTCYVDFNEDFLDFNKDTDSEIAIYSIVNSLVELSYINSVQFTINGDMVEDYNGVIFNKSFERKLELIDERS